jgi:hypothetical protein
MADSGEMARATRPGMTKEASRWRAEPCRSFRIDLGSHFPRTRLLRRRNAKPSILAANNVRGGHLAAICIVFALMLPDAVVSAAAQDSHIAISYGPPRNSAQQVLHDLLKEHRALEKVQGLLGRFRLPRPLTLKLEACEGDSNAWYDEDSVTVCYEYMDDIWRNAPEKTTSGGLTPIDAVLGPLFDVFFHETGHALFDMLKLPVLGREEDAADQVSAYLMLQFGKDEGRRLILGTAHAYKSEVRSATAVIAFFVLSFVLVVIGALAPRLRGWMMGSGAALAMSAIIYFALTSHFVLRKEFADEHGTPAQRLYSLLCSAYGADPQLFADVVQNGYLPNERAEGCAEEYKQVAHAFETLIGPHVDHTLAEGAMRDSVLPDRRTRLPRRPRTGVTK